MENYPVIKDDIKINNLLDLIKIHFYIKILEKNISVEELTDRELSIICELYRYGGLNSKDDLKIFTDICIDKDFCKNSKNAIQSVRNVLGKARIIGVVKRPKAGKWLISNEYLPHIESGRLIFKYTVHNLDI